MWLSSASTATFFVGIGFIAVGLFGQLEAWQFKTAVVSKIARASSMIFGAALIVVSAFVDPPLFNFGWFRAPTGTSYVMDELGGNLQSEKLDIYIADHLVARIVLDASRKRQIVALDVTGMIEQYRLEGLAVGTTSNGKRSDYTGGGSGTIDLTRPAVFAVHTESGKDNAALLSLVKESP